MRRPPGRRFTPLPLRLRPAGTHWGSRDESGLILENVKERGLNPSRPLAHAYINDQLTKKQPFPLIRRTYCLIISTAPH
jgi:hypothetical protein